MFGTSAGTSAALENDLVVVLDELTHPEIEKLTDGMLHVAGPGAQAISPVSVPAPQRYDVTFAGDASPARAIITARAENCRVHRLP